MFKDVRVGDKVGVHTPSGQLPYKMVHITDVYESFLSIGLSCDADGLFYRYSGNSARHPQTTSHIVPEATATLANTLAAKRLTQEEMAAVSWEFEQQIDRVKKLFYRPAKEPTIHQLQHIVNQVKQIG
jgi:hypothetical protein